MRLSIIPLADGGSVRVERAADRSSYGVTRYRSDGTVMAAGIIAYRDDEAVEDTKARAIGELDALDVWPALQRAVKAERRLTDARAGSIRAAAPSARRESGGIILP